MQPDPTRNLVEQQSKHDVQLTSAQAWALRAMRDGYAFSPGGLGHQMMQRPGARPTSPTKQHYTAQTLGRIGAAMANRLHKLGLAIIWHNVRGRSYAEPSDAGIAWLIRSDQSKGLSNEPRSH